MTLKMHIMGESYWRDHPLRKRTVEVAKVALERLQEHISITDLDVMLIPTPNLMLPDCPVSGYCHNGHAVECSFNPDHPKYKTTLDVEIPRLIAHEINHALRYRFSGPWSVGENLVLEGLGLAAERALGCQPQQFKPLPEAVEENLIERAINERDARISPDDDFKKHYWIWEAHTSDHVSNMYYIGRRLVDAALANTEENAFSAIDKPYEWFFKNSNLQV